jgi:ribosomal protein S18 acetylase RimI-like enzyme
MEEITILDAVPDDALGITSVFYKAWLATYPNKERGITVEDIEDSYKDEFSAEKIENLKELIRNGPKNKKRLVAKKGNLIVGACTVIRSEDHNHLRTLYILPEFQHKGIGTKLWNKAMEFLDPTKDTYVQVADYTEQAIHFYKKLGFVDTGKRTPQESGSFKSGAIIMDMEMVRKKGFYLHTLSSDQSNKNHNDGHDDQDVDKSTDSV